MSIQNPSRGGSSSISGSQSWQTSGTAEVQVGKPATEEDLAVRNATANSTEATLDGFRGLQKNVFGGGLSRLAQGGFSGRPEDIQSFLAGGKFDHAAFLSDLRTISTALSKNPVDTALNIVFGLPTEMLDQGLQQLEKQTGLKKEWQGTSSGRVGHYKEYHSQQQLGVLGKHTNDTRTMAGASYETQGSLKVGLAGAHGQGSVVARAGAAVETQGKVRGDLGQLNYSASARTEVYSRADGQFSADARGVQATGRAEAGAMASAEVKADFKSAGVDIGGEPLDVRGQGTARVEAGAKAEASGKLNATLSPPRAGGEVAGKAFAGARAEAEGTLGLGEFASVSGEAGAWAGAGAEGNAVLNFEDGKLRVGFGGGAALLYGAGAGWNAEINVKAIANAAIGGTLQAALAGVDYLLDPRRTGMPKAEGLAKLTESALSRGTRGLQKAVENEVRKAAGSALNAAEKHVRGAVGQALHSVERSVKRTVDREVRKTHRKAKKAVDKVIQDTGKAIDKGLKKLKLF